jgi:hypothetical protein
VFGPGFVKVIRQTASSAAVATNTTKEITDAYGALTTRMPLG